MIKLFPSSWSNAVADITFYGSEGSELHTKYYKKEKTLGLFWPKISQGSQEKGQAIQDLLISLQCIFETGTLSGMNKSERNYYFDKTKEIREKCSRILNEN